MKRNKFAKNANQSGQSATDSAGDNVGVPVVSADDIGGDNVSVPTTFPQGRGDNPGVPILTLNTASKQPRIVTLKSKVKRAEKKLKG